MTIDLSFPIIATQPIPADHGYHLYAALSNTLPATSPAQRYCCPPDPRDPDRRPHAATRRPERGGSSRPRQSDRQFIQLAGKQHFVWAHHLPRRRPSAFARDARSGIRSRLVTIKNGTDPERFTNEVRRKLDAFAVSNEAQVTLGKRRTICIKEKEVVGYEVIIEALTAEESLAIQENQTSGPPELGWSRRHMGCAVFVPLRQALEEDT